MMKVFVVVFSFILYVRCDTQCTVNTGGCQYTVTFISDCLRKNPRNPVAEEELTTPNFAKRSVVDSHYGKVTRDSANRQIREHGLLEQLEQTFTNLRDELSETRIRLGHKESILQDTIQKLNETVQKLHTTEEKLLVTEHRLKFIKTQNRKLRMKLHSTQNKLNKTGKDLSDTIRKLTDAEFDLVEEKLENQELTENLNYVRKEFEVTRSSLEIVQDKFQQLTTEHANVLQELNQTKADLLDCHRAKTAFYCGFEDDRLCRFRQDTTTDHFNWTRGSLKTHTTETGPSFDYTCQNERGYYMYIEATGRPIGASAKLISVRHFSSGSQCLEFFYHMYGEHVGTLHVFTRIPGENHGPLWRAYGNQGNVWSRARILVPADIARRGYYVVFEAITELGSQGDIAIDDFRVFDGDCYDAHQAPVRTKQGVELLDNS